MMSQAEAAKSQPAAEGAPEESNRPILPPQTHAPARSSQAPTQPAEDTSAPEPPKKKLSYMQQQLQKAKRIKAENDKKRMVIDYLFLPHLTCSFCRRNSNLNLWVGKRVKCYGSKGRLKGLLVRLAHDKEMTFLLSVAMLIVRFSHSILSPTDQMRGCTDQMRGSG